LIWCQLPISRLGPHGREIGTWHRFHFENLYLAPIENLYLENRYLAPIFCTDFRRTCVIGTWHRFRADNVAPRYRERY
jgi:hypothetical protein